MNKVLLVGRLTADPELRQTPQGTAVTRFTVAVDRRFRREGGQQADFITCVAWRQQAEFVCRYFNKGKLIGVEGSIQTSSWDGKDGKRQYSTEVICDNVEFVGSKSESGSNGGSNGAYQQNFGGGFNAEPQSRSNSYGGSSYGSDPNAGSSNDGFVDLEFSNDADSEDDLPF
ncbi:MAG: single-stranded DNA-binding protein [Candidatus Ornithomonoglobus sp.]